MNTPSFAPFLAACLLTAGLIGTASADAVIILPANAPAVVRLAAREIRRYTYLCTGELIPIAGTGEGVALKIDPALASEQFRLKSAGNSLTISGGSGVAVLYGAYAFAEKLGVRFYLHGDVIPDERHPLILSGFDETHAPIFDRRGIQPFHDFPDGPDWWNQDDYLAYVGQLAKMKMNFIGLHCYPYRFDNLPHYGSTMIGPEPLVWLGLPQDLNADGTVKSSYPSWWDSSVRRSGWPYAALKTSQYTNGASQLFPTDDYGPDVLTGLAPLPSSPEQCDELFNRVGKQMGAVFSEARMLGVKTCIGTETPMTIPPALASHLRALGKNPSDPGTIEDIYEGAFRRIKAVMPADYYWLWTPEGWGSENFKGTEDDIQAALRALKKSGAALQLATCGWELGPSFDRSAMDKFLPKDCPMSSISSQFGHDGLIPTFAEITGRPKWAIPWMENDVNLIGYEPWVGRIRYDAADARRLGCTGFMGIHWHVKSVMNNFSALAQACWDQSYVPQSFDSTPRSSNTVQMRASAGNTNFYPNTVEGADVPAVYQSIRYNFTGYKLCVPNGHYSVTLKFSEPRYEQAGQRVFGVKVQSKVIADKLDIIAAAGKLFKAYDITAPDVLVNDGTLDIEFQPIVEFPCICGIVAKKTVNGEPFALKVNCGGPSVAGYISDAQGAGERGPENRGMPTDDYYTDFGRSQFGPNAGDEAGKILASLDGDAFRPDMSGWGVAGYGAQGSLQSNPGFHAQAEAKGSIVEKFAALRPKITSAGNLQRFDYWVNTLRASVTMYEAGGIRGDLQNLVGTMKAERDPAKKKELGMKAVALRIALTEVWNKLMRLEILVADTPGELGVISNLERNTRIFNLWLTAYDEQITQAMGSPLPPACQPSMTWDGPAMIKVLTVRTAVSAGEPLSLRIIALDRPAVKNVSVQVRQLGRGNWQSIPAQHLSRSVYQATLPASREDFEYYITAQIATGQYLVWPATAPKLNQTVVTAESL